MPKLRSVLLNALLVFGAVAVSLAVALAVDSWLDLGLRPALALALETNIQQPEPIMYVYDNVTGWRLNPRSQYHRAKSGPLYGLAGVEPLDVKLRVNSEGFVDRDHFLATPYYRIAFLGNSWVEGLQHQYEERFTPLTEKFVFTLSEHKKVVEVMNFGLSNLAPAHDYGVIKHFVLKYQPDEVWVFVNPWDLRSNSSFASPPPFGPTFEYVDDTHRKLKDIHFGFVAPPTFGDWQRERQFADLRKSAAEYRQVEPYFYSDARNAVFDHAWNEMRLTFELIRDTLAANRIRMRIVYLPLPFDVDSKHWEDFRRRAAQDAGRELPLDQGLGERRYALLAKDLGVEFVSLLPLCRQRGAKAMFADHFSALGNFVVADYLARLIIDTAPATPVP